jgi:hypothetical protein
MLHWTIRPILSETAYLQSIATGFAELFFKYFGQHEMVPDDHEFAAHARISFIYNCFQIGARAATEAV